MEVSEQTVRYLHEKAKKASERNVYSLTNFYTSRDEKIEIEAWYQLPLCVAGLAYLIAGILWSQGVLNGWQTYFIALGAGSASAVLIWAIYNRKIIFFLGTLLDFPFLNWLIHLGVAGYLTYRGMYLQAGFVAGNRIFSYIPVSFGAMVTNQILTSKYKMHPKYALLKRNYGKSYPFED